jgi:hypothetical protein
MTQTAKASVIEQIRALQKQQADLLESAKTEALSKAEEAVAELAEIGFSYRLVAGDAKPTRAERAAPAKRSHTDGPCPICGFKTEPPHDRRAHRGQKQKAAFTAAELAERSLAKAS